MHDLQDFLEPLSPARINNDDGYTDGQLARHLVIYENEFPDITDCSIVLVGIQEMRGQSLLSQPGPEAPNKIRNQLYALHYWHTDIKIADIGNIKTGETLSDSYAAIKTVLSALIEKNKTVVLLGGSHDITLAQYEAYRHLNKRIDASCIDARIDLSNESPIRSENFLMEMLTDSPSLINHYNHIAFQSYYVHPRIIETMDKLRFDCYRVGMVQDNIEEMEPPLRHTDLLSFDIAAIKNSDAPANTESPNGLTGIDACTLTRFAGLSETLSSIGFYGYQPKDDVHELTASQIAQMIWYFIDGRNKGLQEAPLAQTQHFNEYHTAFAEVDTLFLQSKKTGRWWMRMPDNKIIACSYSDYIKASNNEIPERWLRLQERDS
ncbi:MAG: formimidoylglutamase [Niastella sp.]|nr:formimidoylglutamase [Niastella sp.]